MRMWAAALLYAFSGGHIGECCSHVAVCGCCMRLLYTGGQYAGGHCTLEVAWVNAVGRVAVGRVAVGRVAVGRVAVDRVAVGRVAVCVAVLWQLVRWRSVSWRLVSWQSVRWRTLYFGGSVGECCR